LNPFYIFMTQLACRAQEKYVKKAGILRFLAYIDHALALSFTANTRIMTLVTGFDLGLLEV